VDEVMRGMQGTFDQAPVEQVRPLSMRVGVVERDGLERRKTKNREMAVAKVIEFYVPSNFRGRVKWVSPERRGKILAFGTTNSLAAPAGLDTGAGDFDNTTALEKIVLS
jgi:hypothetical protein